MRIYYLFYLIIIQKFKDKTMIKANDEIDLKTD